MKSSKNNKQIQIIRPREIVNASSKFYEILQNDKNSRFRSWEHCYYQFSVARKQNKPDYDYLSLHLAFYLASWGMYRGSSFLLDKDYKVHIPMVKEILKKKYDVLAGIDCKEYRNPKTLKILKELEEILKDLYYPIRYDGRKDVHVDISDTLITKILMGTLGCVPAYDRYFKDGVKRSSVSTGIFNGISVLKLVDFYEDNFEDFEIIRNNMIVEGLPYPQMKLLDMGFWVIGFKNDPNNKDKSLFAD